MGLCNKNILIKTRESFVTGYCKRDHKTQRRIESIRMESSIQDTPLEECLECLPTKYKIEGRFRKTYSERDSSISYYNLN